MQPCTLSASMLHPASLRFLFTIVDAEKGCAVSAGLARASPPTEEQLWSYLVQLTAALRASHSARRALRAPALTPSKVLLTSPGRIRVGAHAADSTSSHCGSWLDRA